MYLPCDSPEVHKLVFGIWFGSCCTSFM